MSWVIIRPGKALGAWPFKQNDWYYIRGGDWTLNPMEASRFNSKGEGGQAATHVLMETGMAVTGGVLLVKELKEAKMGYVCWLIEKATVNGIMFFNTQSYEWVEQLEATAFNCRKVAEERAAELAMAGFIEDYSVHEHEFLDYFDNNSSF